MKEYPNPLNTRAALWEWHDCKTALEDVEARIEAAIPVELLDEKAKIQEHLADLRKECETAARSFGDYKDEQGWQCEIEKRETVTYLPERFREQFPQFAEVCIEEIVNKDKVKGLLKGKLITEEQLDRATERTTVEAFILR